MKEVWAVVVDEFDAWSQRHQRELMALLVLCGLVEFACLVLTVERTA